MLIDAKLFFFLVLRLKKIIRAAFVMASTLLISETLEKIVDETCSLIECDRATVFIVDEHKNEIWSQVNYINMHFPRCISPQQKKLYTPLHPAKKFKKT